jgi:enolase
MKLLSVKAREILDSRGNPTIEVEAFTKKNSASAIVPSGASTGIHEALELRDNDKSRYSGKGVLQAVGNVNLLSKYVSGINVEQQEIVDTKLLELDGTENKSRFGANTILGISLAVAKLAAIEQDEPLYKYLGGKNILPVPFCNIINGGKHAGNSLKFQEFMIAPVKARSFSEGIRMVSEVYHELREILIKQYGKSAVNVGDEGGFAPPIKNADTALDLISKAIEQHGYQDYMKLAMDCAASEFYDKRYYQFDGSYSWEKMEKYYLDLIGKYPIISIEDPFDQDDFLAFKAITKHSNRQIVGDDLLCTNINRLKSAVVNKLCNCMLMKVNQVGTLTEAVHSAHFAFKNDFKVMVSHRSGESEDTFIADLSVGIGAGMIKAGAPCRGERTAKYNRLLKIEEELGNKAKYGLN